MNLFRSQPILSFFLAAEGGGRRCLFFLVPPTRSRSQIPQWVPIARGFPPIGTFRSIQPSVGPSVGRFSPQCVFQFPWTPTVGRSDATADGGGGLPARGHAPPLPAGASAPPCSPPSLQDGLPGVSRRCELRSPNSIFIQGGMLRYCVHFPR